jgi:hypothetical protein
MTRRQVGNITVIVGGLVYLSAQTFLAYVEVGRYAPTFWDVETRAPVILTVIGVATVVLAAASLLTDGVIPALVACVCSFYLFGRVFPIGLRSYSDVGVGLWLASAATVAMSIGGILALTGRRGFADRLAKSS